jgi:hypothetical protein
VLRAPFIVCVILDREPGLLDRLAQREVLKPLAVDRCKRDIAKKWPS